MIVRFLTFPSTLFLLSLVSIESRKLLIYQRFGFRVCSSFQFISFVFGGATLLRGYLLRLHLPSLLGRAVENSRVFDSREGLLEGRRKLVNATEIFRVKWEERLFSCRDRKGSCVNNWFGYVKMNPLFVVVDGTNNDNKFLRFQRGIWKTRNGWSTRPSNTRIEYRDILLRFVA